MDKYEWPAEEYAVGSYIQDAIAKPYLDNLNVAPNASLLDIGCGEGSFSMRILEKVPEGKLLGIDRSANMIALARKKMVDHPHFSAEQHDVLTLPFESQFDGVVSFWCLQWCSDLKTAYDHIFHALKKGGQLLTIVPAGVDPLVKSLTLLKASGDFPVLDAFRLPVDFQAMTLLPKIMQALPFQEATVTVKQHLIQLPSLDTFRKFMNGLAFFNGQVPEDRIGALNEAMVHAFHEQCQVTYQGEYWFDLSLYLTLGVK